jgi:hypothetical protein
MAGQLAAVLTDIAGRGAGHSPFSILQQCKDEEQSEEWKATYTGGVHCVHLLYCAYVYNRGLCFNLTSYIC